MSNNNAARIELGLEDGTTLAFNVKREDYIKFINGASKHSFNAMNNLLAASVDAESQAALAELQKNPANVPELAGALLEEYTPDVTVAVKKRSK